MMETATAMILKTRKDPSWRCGRIQLDQSDISEVQTASPSQWLSAWTGRASLLSTPPRSSACKNRRTQLLSLPSQTGTLSHRWREWLNTGYKILLNWIIIRISEGLHWQMQWKASQEQHSLWMEFLRQDSVSHHQETRWRQALTSDKNCPACSPGPTRLRHQEREQNLNLSSFQTQSVQKLIWRWLSSTSAS